MQRSKFRPYLLRLGATFVVSLIAVVLISEIGIRLQNENTARAPKTFELLIPEGTAAQVAAGNEAPGIPSEMNFVLGDVLLVRNEDSVTHTLGPLLIPAASSAQMPLDEAENLALSCSFTPSKYLGIEIRTPTTLDTRLTALSFAVPPTTAILFVYSLLAFPLDGKKDSKKE